MDVQSTGPLPVPEENIPKQCHYPLKRYDFHQPLETIEKTVEVYTEWANHYLEKANHSRFVLDIREDLRTGVLLADIVHSVAHQAVPLRFRQPATEEQKISNVTTCLDLLHQLGVEVENISAKGVVEGELHHILTLFFNLSKYKQNLKIGPSVLTLADSGKPFPAVYPCLRAVANPYVCAPPMSSASSHPMNSHLTMPGPSSKFGYTLPTLQDSHCPVLRVHETTERLCTDSGLGASVTNVSPTSPTTTTSSLTDADPRTVHTRKNQNPKVQLSSALSLSNSSSTNSSSYVTTCLNGGARPREQTSIPVHRKNAVNCAVHTSVDSPPNAAQPKTRLSYKSAGRGTPQLNGPVTQTNGIRVRHPPNGNAVHISNADVGAACPQTGAANLNRTVDSQSSASRGRAAPRSHTGVPRRHFTRRLAPGSSTLGTGNSTVSDGELEKNRLEIPPALPRLSLDRVALTPPAKVFDRVPRTNPPRSQSSMPVPRTGIRSMSYRPQGNNSSQDSSLTSLAVQCPQPQLTGQVVSTNQSPTTLPRLQTQGVDFTRNPHGFSGRSQNGVRSNAPSIWPPGSVPSVQYQHYSETVSADTQLVSLSSEMSRFNSKTNSSSVIPDAFRPNDPNTSSTMIPGLTGHTYGVTEMHSGTYASTSLPGHGNMASTTECAAPSHGIQQRPIPQTIYPYPTSQTPASSVQPAYNPPTQQAVPTRSNPTAVCSNPCLSSTPSPFVAPAVHRPAGQFHPIPPTRQQSLLRTQMLSGPVPDGKLPDTLNSELHYSNANIVKQHRHQQHHHQPSTMPEDLAYNKSKTNNGTVGHYADPRKSSVSAKSVTTEQYVINSNQSLKSPNGPRKSNSTQAEQRQRARELYAALKHRHPVTTDFGVGKASNSSDEQETKWLRKSLSRRCTTNGSTGLSSATAIPTRDEPTQTNGLSHTDLSSSSVPVSSTASVVSNSVTSWPTVGSVTSEQLAKMLQTGDPQVRSYLQAYVRRPGTNGPPQPPPPPPTVPPPPPPLSSAPYSVHSTPTDQATFIQARAEPGKSVANLPCAVPVDDAGWGGLSLDARRRRRPALGEEAKAPTLDPLAASLSSSVSAASNFPIRNTESTASSLPRHVRLSMFSSSLGPEPAPPNTVTAAQRRPSASIQSDVEPPVSPDLSAYAKRMQERMKEGLRAAQESLWVSSQSRTGSLITVPKTSKTDPIYDRINNMTSTNSTTLPALTEPSSVLNQAVVDDLERGQLDMWDRGRRPTHDRFSFDVPGLSTLVGSGSVQTDTVSASRVQSRLHAPIRYPTLPSWTPSYTNGPTKSNAFSELGKINPRPVSATGHNSRRDCEERLFGEAKNGTCSDVEDLLDQAKRKMFPLLDEQVSNRKDIKLAFNSSSDTEDIFTTVNRLHRSAGMHFGYTLPGPKASWFDGKASASGSFDDHGGGDNGDMVGYFGSETGFTGRPDRISSQSTRSRNGSDLERLMHLNSNISANWSRASGRYVSSGPSNGADGQSPERGGNDLDRIYGIVPWSPGGLRHSRPFQPSFLSAQRSPDPGPPPDGSASAPPGTPIKLPYAAPSTLFTAAMVRPEFAHLFDEDSNLSLSSNTSQASTTEEKQAEEIQRLRRKLELAQQQVAVLTSQLVTNAHVVSAFEQSLNNMSQRLQNLTNTTAKKDSELHELRATIEALRSQTGLGLSKLWSKPQQQQSSDSGNGKSVRDGNHTVGSSISLTGPETQSDGLGSAQQLTCQSALTSPHKAALTSNLKENEAASKKNTGWFRASIGKAFRKKTSAQSVASTTSSSVESATPTITDTRGRLHSSNAVGQANTNTHPISNSVTLVTQNSIINSIESTTISTTAASRSNNTNYGLGVPPKATAPPTSGLSPSDSSTSSSSCSWGGAMGSSNHAPETLSSSGRTDSVTSGRLADWKLPSLATASGLNLTNADGALASGIDHGPNSTVIHLDGGSQEQEGTLRSFDSAHSPTSSSLINSSELPTSTDSGTRSTWNMAQLQAELVRLRNQLNERELKLTDVQLEALASTHQVNQLRDQISRLYSEMEHLRTDNERLHMLVQHEKPEAIGIHRIATNHNGDKEPHNHAGECVKSRLSGPLTPTNMNRMPHRTRHCLCGFEIDLLSGLDNSTVEAGASVTVALWSLVSVQMTSLPSCSVESYHMGLVNLKEYPTWEGLDHRLSQMWTEYTQRLDPTDRLGLSDYRLMTVRVNGNRTERPISRNSVGVDAPELRNASVEGELACLVQEAQMAPQSRTVILAQIVPSGSVNQEKNNDAAEWSLDCLEPQTRLRHWIQCLTRYRCAAFYAVLHCDVEPIVNAMAYQLQSTGHVSRIVHRRLDQNPDDTIAWLKKQLAVPVEPVGSVAIVLNCLEMIGAQRFLSALSQVESTESPSSKSAHDTIERGLSSRFHHYILATVSAGATNCVPPTDSIPVDSTELREESPFCCSVSGDCCWIPVGTWSRSEAMLRIHHSLTRNFIHQSVEKLLDETRSQQPRSFGQMQFMSSVVQWLEELWKRTDEFLQQCSTTDAKEDLAELSPALFDHLPLVDPEQCARAFVDCWNNLIGPLLRHKFGQYCINSNELKPPDPRDWIVNTWPWNSMSDLAKIPMDLHPVINLSTSTAT